MGKVLLGMMKSIMENLMKVLISITSAELENHGKGGPSRGKG